MSVRRNSTNLKSALEEWVNVKHNQSWHGWLNMEACSSTTCFVHGEAQLCLLETPISLYALIHIHAMVFNLAICENFVILKSKWVFFRVYISEDWNSHQNIKFHRNWIKPPILDEYVQIWMSICIIIHIWLHRIIVETWIISSSVCVCVCGVLIPITCIIFHVPKLVVTDFLSLSDTKVMITCSCTIHFKKISACSKVLVEWQEI